MTAIYYSNILAPSKICSWSLIMIYTTAKRSNLYLCKKWQSSHYWCVSLAHMDSILKAAACTFTNNNATTGGSVLSQVGATNYLSRPILEQSTNRFDIFQYHGQSVFHIGSVRLVRNSEKNSFFSENDSQSWISNGIGLVMLHSGEIK